MCSAYIAGLSQNEYHYLVLVIRFKTKHGSIPNAIASAMDVINWLQSENKSLDLRNIS